MGLPTQSTDVTFKGLVHSTGSVGLPTANQPCETQGGFSPSARTSAETVAQIPNVPARLGSTVRCLKKLLALTCASLLLTQKGPDLRTNE